PAFASGETQSRRSELSIHLGNGWHYLLPFHRAHVHRSAADVLLPPEQDSSVSRHTLSGARRALRKASAEHASLGGAPDGDYDLAAHVSRCVDRLVQEAARIQLVRWRSSACFDVTPFIYGIFVARRSTGLLGGDRGNKHGAGDSVVGPRGAIRRSVGIDAVQ